MQQEFGSSLWTCDSLEPPLSVHIQWLVSAIVGSLNPQMETLSVVRASPSLCAVSDHHRAETSRMSYITKSKAGPEVRRVYDGVFVSDRLRSASKSSVEMHFIASSPGRQCRRRQLHSNHSVSRPTRLIFLPR